MSNKEREGEGREREGGERERGTNNGKEKVPLLRYGWNELLKGAKFGN